MTRAMVAESFALAALAGIVWYFSLPHLDPTGQEDSSAAMMAMVEGRPVLNVATHWPMTRTGWPFFGRYGADK